MDKILVCDDEKDIVAALTIYLRAEGYDVIPAYNGKEALEILETTTVSLILLDIMMPVMDGITALSRLRETSNIPVILLTAKGEDADKVLGLNVGADDYIAKPFHPAELVARVKAQLRRYLYLGSRVNQPELLTCGGLELDPDRRLVTLDGTDIPLTPTEFSILRVLMESGGTVLSTKEIYRRAFRADTTETSENTVAVHIRHLREKIELDPANPRFIRVIWGRGYQIDTQKKE